MFLEVTNIQGTNVKEKVFINLDKIQMIHRDLVNPDVTEIHFDDSSHMYITGKPEDFILEISQERADYAVNSAIRIARALGLPEIIRALEGR